ncbi:MAG: DUF3817 domain-containing protein [Chitinophagales bacterium]|nr:DUF3817 domain-containing protein [Chitinophagales bacterium]
METTSNTKIIDSLVQRFLVIGKTEGYSYLILLFIAMPLKYAAGFPIAVRIAGSLHGILFIAFVYYILKMLQANRLDLKKAVFAFILSLLPFGTFYLRRLI